MKFHIQNSTRAMWATFFANVIFGFSFLFTKISLQYTSPYVLLSCRFFVALIVFTLFLFLGKRTLTWKGKPWGMLLLLGSFQPVLYFIGETYGVLYTSSTFSAIMIALIPVVSLWASALFLKESPTTLQSIFCCLSVFGVILITANAGGGTSQLKGIIFLLFAVFADVAFNLISRKISVSFSSFERTYVMFFVGFFVFFMMMLAETQGSIAPFFLAFQNSALRFPIFYLGIASSVIAFFLINYAHTHLPVTRTIVFVNVTTLISVLAGVIFLHEVLPLLSIMAAGMILIGVWGVQRFPHKLEELHKSTSPEEI